MWTILIVLVVAIAAFLMHVATKPDARRFERPVAINASAEAVFPLINDRPASVQWNPFVKKDPNIEGSYSGPTAGPGAKYTFVRNLQVGSGSVEIIDSKASEYVHLRLLTKGSPT
jgi:hypothetical protein